MTWSERVSVLLQLDAVREIEERDGKRFVRRTRDNNVHRTLMKIVMKIARLLSLGNSKKYGRAI